MVEGQGQRIVQSWQAHQWGKIDLKRPSHRLKYDLLKKYESKIPSGAHILEIGCGDGRWLQVFGKDKTCKGIDIVEKHIETCKEKGLDCAIGDARKLDFPDESFDMVFSWGTIEHFHETAQAAQEHFRVCKPGGYVIIQILNKLTPLHVEEQVGNLLKKRSYEEHMAKFGKRLYMRDLRAMVHPHPILEEAKFGAVAGQILGPLNKLLEPTLSRYFGGSMLVVCKK